MTEMTESRTLAQQVADHLATLGAGPIEIAASLHAAGIRGHLRNPTHCPISIYLTHQLGAGVGVVTSPEHLHITALHITALSDDAHLPTPLPTSLFVRAFDRGMYPHLIAERGAS
jgi:hypothetical protein